MARVLAICIADASSAPMRPLGEARLVAGVGIEGDRYANGRGHWTGWPDAELTLVDAKAAAPLGIAATDLRRNIVTEGIDLATLNGRRATLGKALIEGVRPCDPCGHLEALLARPGLKAALEGRGGLRARVVEGGVVRVGDAIEAGSDRRGSR